ncbi:MAG: hypothetical protein SFT68_03840 [Rickettsiaceae bacterium]|nr:hypothetical protein [Rickettsiaceae bacterium]
MIKRTFTTILLISIISLLFIELSKYFTPKKAPKHNIEQIKSLEQVTKDPEVIGPLNTNKLSVTTGNIQDTRTENLEKSVEEKAEVLQKECKINQENIESTVNILKTYNLIKDLYTNAQQDRIDEAKNIINTLMNDNLIMKHFGQETKNIAEDLNNISKEARYTYIFPRSYFLSWMKNFITITRLNNEYITHSKLLIESIKDLKNSYLDENNIKKMLIE